MDWSGFLMSRSWSRTIDLRLVSLVTMINVLVAAGFAVVGVVAPMAILPPGEATNGAYSLFALYAAARAVPLAALTLVAVYRRAMSALLVLGGLAGVIQFLDAGIGLMQADAGKAIGPLIIGILQMAALWRVNRSKEDPGSRW
jgi:hypothetical protein